MASAAAGCPDGGLRGGEAADRRAPARARHAGRRAPPHWALPPPGNPAVTGRHTRAAVAANQALSPRPRASWLPPPRVALNPPPPLGEGRDGAFGKQRPSPAARGSDHRAPLGAGK